MTDTTPTPADRPAEGLAATIETVLRESLPVWWQTPPRLDWAALAVARQLLSTTEAEDDRAATEKKMAALQRRRDEVGAECRRRGKRVLEQSEQIRTLERTLDETRRQLGQEILRAGEAEAALNAAPPAPADRAATRDRIRRAVCEAEGFAWDTDMLEPDEYGEVADAVLAVLDAPADRGAEAKAATIITRLRAERAELNRRLDCLRGDMRDMEHCLREQDAEFERIRSAASEANPARRRLTPNEHDRAWHAIEGSAGEPGADPGTVLNAVLHALRIDAPTPAEEQAASPSRRLADDAAAGVQPPTSETATHRASERLDLARAAVRLHRLELITTAELYAVIEAQPATPPAAPAAPEEQR